jgi:hypothetical protein
MAAVVEIGGAEETARGAEEVDGGPEETAGGAEADGSEPDITNTKLIGTGDFPKRIGMSGRRRPAARTALRHRGDREGMRRSTVPRILFTPEGCEELAARVWGVVESPGSVREAGNN